MGIFAESTTFDNSRQSMRSNLHGMRVAMVAFSQHPSDPRPRRAAEAMVNEGMSVDVICIGGAEDPRREVLNGVKIYRVRITHRRGSKILYACHYFSFLLICTLILAVRSLGHPYDLVHIHNMPDILVVSSLLPKFLGARVILDMHDPMPELMRTIFNLDETAFSVRLMKVLERWSMKHADAVITVNMACKHIFSSRSCSSEKVQVVMNSPDERIFPVAEPCSKSGLKNTPDKSFTIVYHGSIVERNGLDLAIDAFEMVKRSIPTARLRIYGRKTRFLEQVMEQVSKKGLNDCVFYLGQKHLEDLVHEIQQCDVGIIPNHRNAFTEINTPTRIFEYLALGRPVVAPKTQGIEDYFSDGSLLFFEPGNPNDLAEKIAYVYSCPGKTIDLVKRGQQVYHAHTWSQERETLVNLLNELLKGKK